MSLDKTINELANKTRKISPYCAFQMLYNSLPEQDKKALDAAIAKNLPQSLIVKALRKEGYKASSDTLRTHLKGDCRCPRK